MSKLNQKGFSLVEGLLVIIALALIVFVGYYVWNAQKNTDKTLDSASKASQSASKGVGSSSKEAATVASETSLHTYLLQLCSASDKTNIDAMFANKASQTVDTDSFQLEGKYAITNTSCTLKSGTELTTQVLKFMNADWALLINEPTGIGCSYLTNQGFPDKLKAPYCSNGSGQEMLN